MFSALCGIFSARWVLMALGQEDFGLFGLIGSLVIFITKSELNDTILMPYEHITVPAPRNYDEILRRIYGDYGRYPAEEERGAWHEGIIHFEPEIPYGKYISNMSEK